MPFKSKAQQRFMFAAEERGDVPKGTAMEWAHKTEDIKNLPEKKTASDIAQEVLSACQTPGMKIRSKKKGRGMGVGGGKGPVGIPIEKKATAFAPAALSAMSISKKLKIRKWKQLKEEAKNKKVAEIAKAALATDGGYTTVMHDLYRGGSWAPGGIEYQGPMKIAAELPTNLMDRPVAAIGSVTGAPKIKLPTIPKPPKPPKVKKTAAEIARLVMMKSAALLPEEMARNYFFANPYGLDFHTWADMQDTPEGEDIPTEAMPEVEGEEPPYDADTEAAYMPNAPDTAEVGTEPPVSPVASVPLPHGRVRKTAALLHAVAEHELSRRGILKVSTPENKSDLQCKVEVYLQRKAAAELIPGGVAAGEPDTKYPKKQLEMGVDIEKEHSPVPAKAKEIAKDHLEEHPQYYSALKAMEKRLEEKKEAASSLEYDLDGPYTDPLAKLPLYTTLGAGSSGLGTGMGKAFRDEIGGFRSVLKPKDLIKHIKNMPMSGHAKILGKGLLGGGLAAGVGYLGGNLLEGKIRGDAANKAGRKLAAAKFGLDASELLGQDEQRKDDIHQQQVRHNEENHQIELAKGQLELQQAQETFAMKQQQQAQKNQEQMAQQQMAQQMQAQQQQQMSQQYMSNMAGGGGQQPPQQGMAGPR